jgi:lysophospholipase L1-like esterase
MVAEEQTFPARTAAALASEGVPTESLNAGVIGYSIFQGLSRYREFVRAYKPDAVVIGFGVVNEHLNAPGQEPDRLKAQRLKASEDWIGRTADWCRSSLRIAHLASWLRFQRMGGEAAVRKSLREAKRKDISGLEEVGKTSYEGKRRVSLPEYSDLIDELVSAIRLDGARAILLSMPRKLSAEERSPVLVEYSNLTMLAGERLGIPALDIRSLLRSYSDLYDPEKKDAAELGFFFDYWHPRPHGHRLIADALKPHLLSIAQESGRKK